MSLDEFLHLGRVDLFDYMRCGTNLFLGVLGALYLIDRKRRGDDLRECGLVAVATAVCFALPGVSWLVQHFMGLPRVGHSIFEFFPVVLLAAEAGTEIMACKEKQLSKRAYYVLALFLLALIPMGLSVGIVPNKENNIVKGKSFTGVTSRTQTICENLHSMFGDEVYTILPMEYQKDIGITDTGVTCPEIDWNSLEETASQYMHQAKIHKAHVIVIPTHLAEGDRDTMSADGFNMVCFLGFYEIWTGYELDD